MIIVVSVDAEGRVSLDSRGGTPPQILLALQAAAQGVAARMAGAKLHLPNGQTKIVSQQPPEGTAPQ